MSEELSKVQAIDLIEQVWPHSFHTPPPADMAMEAEYRDVEALAVNSFAAGVAAGKAAGEAGALKIAEYERQAINSIGTERIEKLEAEDEKLRGMVAALRMFLESVTSPDLIRAAGDEGPVTLQVNRENYLKSRSLVHSTALTAEAYTREVERRVLLEVKKEGWELRNSWKNCTTPELEAIDKRLAALAPSAPVDAKEKEPNA